MDIAYPMASVVARDREEKKFEKRDLKAVSLSGLVPPLVEALLSIESIPGTGDARSVIVFGITLPISPGSHAIIGRSIDITPATKE
jgi:hypothetical protein